MKVPIQTVYSLPFFACFLAVWLLEPLIHHYFIPLDEKIQMHKSQVAGVKVIAHRGASGHAPENTLAAIQKAIDLKADIVEIDVHMSRDGEVVVIHDETLDRTTNGQGRVHDKDLEALKKLDAGSWFSDAYQGQQIPTLNEVLQLLAGKAVCLIEIKWAGDFVYEGIIHEVHRSIAEYHAQDWVIIQSFENAYLEASHQLNPDIPVQKLIVFEEAAPLASFHLDKGFHLGTVDIKPYYQGINPYYLSMTQRRIAGLHTAGKSVFAYTVDDSDDMKQLILMGVDGIITNFPDRMIELKSSWEESP